MLDASWVFNCMVGIGMLGVVSPLVISFVSKNKSGKELVYLFITALLFIELVFGSFMAYKVLTTGPVFLWNDRVLFDGFGSFIILFIVLIGFLIYIVSYDFYMSIPGSESFSSIFMLAYLGSILIALSGSISLFFVSWIMTSIASYVLVGIDKRKISSDAALKYAILGGVSSVFLVLWISTGVYFNGDVLWKGINSFLYSPAVVISALFLMVGAGFKMGAVPFHWWLPDVYSRADGRIISFITGVVKLGVVAGFTRMLAYTVLGKEIGLLLIALSVVAVFSMTFGNIAALTTDVFSRVMAYSSIAQIGYIFVGVVALAYSLDSGSVFMASVASAAIVVHVIGYSLAKPIAFTVSGLLGEDARVNDLKGLWKEKPLLAFSLFISLMSLLGLPPLLGFWGKLYLFKAGLTYSFILVLIAIVNSGISSYYYGRIVREVFTGEPNVKIKDYSVRVDNILFALAILLIMLGLGAVQGVYPLIHMVLP